MLSLGETCCIAKLRESALSARINNKVARKKKLCLHLHIDKREKERVHLYIIPNIYIYNP